MKTVREASAKLKITPQRVCQLIRRGHLAATWIAGKYMIEPVVLAEFARRKRRAGRPKQVK